MAVAASTVEEASELLAELVWLVLLAGALAGLAAFLYRWYVREEVPTGLSLLVGLAGVTVYLNTSRALGQVIGGSTLPTEREVALFNIAAFALATGAAVVGRRVGDRLGSDVALRSDVQGIDRDVGRLVETVGRVIAVELPEDIEDVVGYDPVPEETKEKLAGRTFLFPRRLTVEELRERLVSRLKADYAVGTVDVDLAGDGTVEYLALGSRAAGIGPTLPPETNAVAVRADPAFSASAGDLVQLWETDPPRRVLTAELRGVADDVVTLAIDAADTTKVDPRRTYRLVTLPVGDRPDREFASLLRAATETFSSAVVAAGSPLHGMPISALGVAVIAVKPEGGQAVALPDPDYVLTPGDRVFAIARPETLRRLERAAEPLEPVSASGTDQSEPPAGAVDTSVDESEPTADGDEPASDTGTDDPVADTGTDEPVSDAEDTETAPPADAPEASDAAAEPDESPADGPASPEDGPESPEDGPESPADGLEPPTADAETQRVSDESAGTADAADDGAVDGRADASAFEDLKNEFESGEADWIDENRPGEQPADDLDSIETGNSTDEPMSGGDETDEDDDLLSLDGDDRDDGLSSLDLDDEDDDLSSLDVDDEDASLATGSDEDDLVSLDEAGDDLLSGDGEDVGALDLADDFDDDFDSDLDADFGESVDGDLDEGDPGSDDEDGEDGEDDEDGEDGEDDEDGEAGGDDEDGEASEDDGDGESGGGKSFQELKEEFESGDADWADEVSDSPGGDMRLDE